jgi:hypothetical protein
LHKKPRRRGAPLTLALLAILALGAAFAASASAEALVNGDFETGNFDGWKVQSLTGDGEWLVLGTEEGLEAPFSGRFLALTEEGGPDRMTISQEVALAPGESHVFSGAIGYESSTEMVTPDPNTLAINGMESANQQLRVDVLRPGASLASVSGSDVLATLFATQTGDPEGLEPQRFEVDLTAFAGQSVVIRAVNAVNDGPMSAFVDDFSITGKAGPPLPPAPVLPPPPSNIFSKGKLKLNKVNGTAKLTLTVPGPGVVKVADAKKKKKLVKGTSVTAGAAGTITVPLKPTGKGTKALNANGKVAFKVKLSFTPTGGTAATQTATGTLKLAPPKR